MNTAWNLLALTGILALTACGSSSGGGATGGGGGGGGGMDFDTEFSAAQLEVPTQTPITGSADYAGQVNITTAAGANDVDVVGDLDLTISFDGGDNPISGTASNFAGTVDGTDVDYDGELSTATAIANGTNLNAVTAQTVNAPVVGDITTTGITVALEGTLTDPATGSSGETQLTLQGNMTGTDGAGSFGVAGGSGSIDGETAGLIGGQYYLEKQ